MIDLNDFKEINDSFGHQEGDKVLKTVSDILVSVTNPVDTVARYGGDEFLILVESDNAAICTDLIERIENNLNIHNRQLDNYKISLSFGASFIPGNTRFSLEQIIKDIDEKMYIDKKRRKR